MKMKSSIDCLIYLSLLFHCIHNKTIEIAKQGTCKVRIGFLDHTIDTLTINYSEEYGPDLNLQSKGVLWARTIENNNVSMRIIGNYVKWYKIIK